MSSRTLINGLTIQEAVTAGGLPRVVQASDGTQDVMYLAEGAYIAQSMGAAEWVSLHGALPSEPTQAEIDAALAARAAAAQRATTDAAQLRQQVLADLQSGVGVPFAALNTTQLRAVVEALAWKAGMLNRDTTVRPPSDYLDRK